MDHRTTQVSPLYLLERFDVGLVELDADRRVTAMNDFARRVLPVDESRPFDRMVLSFHPERSQPKVEFLLDQAAQCPVANPPPMTMIINIPERVLLIKVSRMSRGGGDLAGYALVFYDITDVVSADEAASPRHDQRRRLLKIPTVSNHRIVFVDIDDGPNCGGELKIIAAILEQPVIEKILTHLGLQARAPPPAPERGQALQVA